MVVWRPGPVTWNSHLFSRVCNVRKHIPGILPHFYSPSCSPTSCPLDTQRRRHTHTRHTSTQTCTQMQVHRHAHVGLQTHKQGHRLPRWPHGKEPAGDLRDTGSDLWVRKIPWRRAGQPTPVILPGGSHGQRSQSIGSQRVEHS